MAIKKTKDGFPDKRYYGKDAKKLIDDARSKIKTKKKDEVLKDLNKELAQLLG